MRLCGWFCHQMTAFRKVIFQIKIGLCAYYRKELTVKRCPYFLHRRIDNGCNVWLVYIFVFVKHVFRKRCENGISFLNLHFDLFCYQLMIMLLVTTTAWVDEHMNANGENRFTYDLISKNTGGNCRIEIGIKILSVQQGRTF